MGMTVGALCILIGQGFLYNKKLSVQLGSIWLLH